MSPTINVNTFPFSIFSFPQGLVDYEDNSDEEEDDDDDSDCPAQKKPRIA